MQSLITVKLLIIKDGENKHFVTINNISRLLCRSKYDKGMYYCKKCYCSFNSKDKLENIHISLCMNVNNVLTIMPERNKNDIKKCKDFYMQVIQPFMIIADFETYANNLNQLKPYSFAMFTHCIFNVDSNKIRHYTAKNCLDEFFDHLIQHINHIDKIKAKPYPHFNPTE